MYGRLSLKNTPTKSALVTGASTVSHVWEIVIEKYID
jgi:hypothetical protein